MELVVKAPVLQSKRLGRISLKIRTKYTHLFNYRGGRLPLKIHSIAGCGRAVIGILLIDLWPDYSYQTYGSVDRDDAYGSVHVLAAVTINILPGAVPTVQDSPSVEIEGRVIHLR